MYKEVGESQTLNSLAADATILWENNKKFITGLLTVLVVLAVGFALFGNTRESPISATLTEGGEVRQCYVCDGTLESECGLPFDSSSVSLTECPVGHGTCVTQKTTKGDSVVYNRKCGKGDSPPGVGGPYDIGKTFYKIAVCNTDGCNNRGACIVDSDDSC